MRKSFLTIAALGALLNGVAQSEQSPRVVQFSGLVVTGDSLTPVAFTTVFRERDQRGTITDNLGFFSIPALAGDTVSFSCIGYLPATFVIPDTLSESRYNMVQLLSRDTVMLSTTFIYPWPTKERFKQEFLALELPNSRDELAQKNLETAEMYQRMRQIDPDYRDAYHYAMSRNTQQITYAGMMPTTGLFSPLAWAQFVNAWRSGAFRKQ